ncbi:MAG: hypothetical protein FJ221_10255 [Lentisphaerae bacterium]|nr:hypothetical protein [Lentisphaerota bacterium]
MQGISFEEAVALIRENDPRFEADAYFFLREALDHTLKSLKKPPTGPARHVSGRELSEGFRELALKQFGPMALRVLAHWGVRRTEDIGSLVFNLVGSGVLGASDEDRPEDFAGGYDFETAFRFPFLPAAPRRRATRKATKEARP